MDDIETEGKKRGYTKAAAEYEAVFKPLQQEYDKVKRLLSEQMDSKDEQLMALVNQLEESEKKREWLERNVTQKADTVASHLGVPRSMVMEAISGSGFAPTTPYYGIFDSLYSQKKKKLLRAEEAGYDAETEEERKKSLPAFRRKPAGGDYGDL